MAQRENTVYKVFITTLEMLEDRKYDVSKYSKDISVDDFHVLYSTGNLDLVVGRIDNPEDQIYVKIFTASKSFAKKDYVAFYDKVKMEHGDIEIILITEDVPPSAVKKEIDANKKIQLFQFKQLIFNITKHDMVPPHTLLTEEESQREVFDRYKVTKAQLPKMLITDPVAKYYGMKSGDICRIVRQSTSTGQAVVYRIVR